MSSEDKIITSRTSRITKKKKRDEHDLVKENRNIQQGEVPMV